MAKPDLPTSRYDDSRISKDIREKLQDIDPKLATAIRKVADQAPNEPPSKRP